ncbi:MAG: hypothetical protein LBQ09_09845, partial [Acidobacteriaceae bacterium]|nr:hypothetical protein [Acidobacteriaceae bacterium]
GSSPTKWTVETRLVVPRVMHASDPLRLQPPRRAGALFPLAERRHGKRLHRRRNRLELMWTETARNTSARMKRVDLLVGAAERTAVA